MGRSVVHVVRPRQRDENVDVAVPADFEAMWPVFQAVVATGTTYVHRSLDDVEQ